MSDFVTRDGDPLTTRSFRALPPHRRMSADHIIPPAPLDERLDATYQNVVVQHV